MKTNIYQLMLEARLNFSKKYAFGRDDAIERVRSKFLDTSERAFVGIDDDGDMWMTSTPQTKSELHGWVLDNNGSCGEFVGTVPANKIANWCNECHEVHLSLFDAEFL